MQPIPFTGRHSELRLLRAHLDFERLGYVHHSIIGEPAIARGYFEAGLSRATSPQERILLLCRIAMTFQAGPQFLDYLEKARQVVPEDPALWGPINLLQFGYDLHVGDLSQARRLVWQTQTSPLPPDMALQIRRYRLNLARTQGNREELQHQLAALERDAQPGDTSLRAAGNNRSAAARRLGMGRATLYRKLRQHGINL